MKNNNNCICILALLVFSVKISSQAPDIKSPQTYQFEKYGNIPVNLNSGGNSYSINLFNFPVSDNEDYNVNLSYYGTGFVPAKKANYVGLDWSLDFGGSVTRTVRGVADDFMLGGSSNELYGYLEGVRACNRDNYSIYTGNYSHSPVSSSAGVGIKCGTFSYELEPDIFNFNFAGKSGYFYIGNNGIPVIASEEKGLRIDITGLSSKQPLQMFDDGSRCKTKESTITITDGKGVKYHFGGKFENLDISYPMGGSQSASSKFTITAWNLYKIEYPNNNVIDITYIPVPIDLSDRTFCYDRDFMQNIKEPLVLFLDQAFVYERSIHAERYGYSIGNLLYDGAVRWGDGSSYNDTGIGYARQQASKKSLPQRITFNDTQIVSFNYERFDKYAQHRLPSYRLTGIAFSNQVGQAVKSVNLTYYRNKDYFFLDKVKMFLKSKLSFEYFKEYSFDYYSKDNLPDDSTTGIDYYGYWNGQPATPLVPKFTVNKSTADYAFTETFRESNPSLFSTSLLKSITYPSKGKTEFIYEPHSYSQKLDRNYASQFKNVIIDANGYTGGGRVQKIINYAETGQIADTKEYKYIKNYNPNVAGTASSGILSNYYRFLNYISKHNSNGQYEKLDVYSNNVAESAMNGTPVLYSEVTEIGSNNSYTKYFFTDHVTHPDNMAFHTIWNDLEGVSPVYDYRPSNILNIDLPFSSNSKKRGRIFKQELYDSSFNKIRETLTEYTDVATPSEWHNFATLSKASYVNKYNIRQYGNTFVPTKVTTTEIFPSSTVNSVTEYRYRYDKPHVLEEIKTIDSDNEEIYTSYVYATGLNAAMADKNMVEIPIADIQRKNGKLIYGSRTTYSQDLSTSNLVKPTQVELLDMVTQSTIPDATFDLYDSKGNLLQYTRNGISTTLLYGYNQSLPLVKIEGATYAQLASILSFPNTNDGYKSLQLITSSNSDTYADYETQTLLPLLDGLRQNTLLKEYQITTYTHDPLIGVTSITPPSGLRQIYLYDKANRLKEVKTIEKDSNGNTVYKLLKEYQYNYKQ